MCIHSYSLIHKPIQCHILASFLGSSFWLFIVCFFFLFFFFAYCKWSKTGAREGLGTRLPKCPLGALICSLHLFQNQQCVLWFHPKTNIFSTATWTTYITSTRYTKLLYHRGSLLRWSNCLYGAFDLASELLWTERFSLEGLSYVPQLLLLFFSQSGRCGSLIAHACM